MAPTNYKMVPRAAVARGDACQAIEHDKHDLPLRLTKEEDTNSLRQFTPEMIARGNAIRERYLADSTSVTQDEIDSVPTIAYEFRETKDGYESITTDYNSTVNVDEDRLLNPSTTNGVGTSRYGKGRAMMLAKRDPTQTHPYSVTWHKSGDAKAYGYTGPDIQSRDSFNVATDPSLPSNDKNKAWFRSESYIDKDALEKAKTPRGIGVMVREVLLITNNQTNIDNVRRSITVTDKNGVIVFEDNSWDGRWKCWEEIVLTRKDLFKLWPKIRKELGPNAYEEMLPYQMLKEDPELLKVFPNYGHLSHADSRAFLFLGSEMVEDCPVRFMGRARDDSTKPLADHPASQTSFGAIVRFMNADGNADVVEVLPTPATIKIQFLKSCKMMKAALEAIRDSRPTGWIKYSKSESPKRKPAAKTVVSAPPAGQSDATTSVQTKYPEEKWVNTEHGLSIEGESKREANESDAAYMKRIIRNRYSRNKKKQDREIARSGATSPASVTKRVEPEHQPTTDVSYAEVPVATERPAEVPDIANAPVDDNVQWAAENYAHIEWVRANIERLRRMGIV